MENRTGAAADTPALGRVSVIPGENPRTYDDLLARFTAALKPVDIVEETWVRDVADLTWEVLRMRRLKANLLSSCAHQGLYEVVQVFDPEDAGRTPRAWAARNPQAIRRVDAALSTAGFSLDTVMAHTLSRRMGKIERIERMTAAAERRRDMAVQQIRRNRAG